MKILFTVTFYLLTIITAGQETIKRGFFNGSKDIPVLNKEKRYPKGSFKFKPEHSYVFLETNKDVLIDKAAHIYYVSDKRILIVNTLSGDIFLFDMDGKAISKFNHKGGYGYVWITYAAYDEKSGEIYILDGMSKKIAVFSENGALKRTLRLPYKLAIREIQIFNEHSLLAFHEHQYGKVTQKKPYLFLSKKDGTILSELNIRTDKVNPREHRGEVWTVIINNYSGNCKFGNEYILANMSCDTIYHLTKDKTLSPLFVQSPSVFSDPPVITAVGMKTDGFVTFSTFPYDLKKARRDHRNGKKQDPLKTGARFFIYEFKTKQFFELEKQQYWAEKIDIPSNMSVSLMPPYVLKAWLERGRLDGKLKKIAKEIDINDNPVIQITKFK